MKVCNVFFQLYRKHQMGIPSDDKMLQYCNIFKKLQLSLDQPDQEKDENRIKWKYDIITALNRTLAKRGF